MAITLSCLQTFSPLSDLAFLRAGVPFRTNVQACCCYNRCLQNRLGGCVKRVCSLWLLDGTLTALAYQLPRVASSAVRPTPVSTIVLGQACVDLHEQHCDGYVHQQPRQSMLTSHHNSPAFSSYGLSSSSSRSTSSHPGRAQLCSQHALTTAHICGRM